MKLTPEQVKEQLKEMVAEESLNDLEKDNRGQLIIYSNIFVWSDGSFHDEPEEEETGVFSVRSILNDESHPT